MNPFNIPDNVYNLLKKIALIALPTLSSAYVMASQVFDISETSVAQVVGSVAIVQFVLGAFLGISTRQYNNSDDNFDGSLHASIDEVTGDQRFVFEVREDPEVLVDKDRIVFKVSRP